MRKNKNKQSDKGRFFHKKMKIILVLKILKLRTRIGDYEKKLIITQQGKTPTLL
jgi:hypothetical protein